MDDERSCIQCGKPLDNHRSDAVFCRQKCKRRFYRAGGGSNYLEPLSPGTSDFLSQHRAEQRFRAALDAEASRAAELTDDEIRALALQRRNPGPLVPYLQQRLDERNAAELAAREYAAGRGIKVEDRLDPASIGSVASRGRDARAMNRPQDPHKAMLRPAPPPGQMPWDDAPQMIQIASRNTPRWAQ